LFVEVPWRQQLQPIEIVVKHYVYNDLYVSASIFKETSKDFGLFKKRRKSLATSLFGGAFL